MIATAHAFNLRNYHKAQRTLTVGISTFVCLSSVPPGVGGVIRLLAVLSAFGLSCMSIASLFEELVNLEGVRGLLIKIPSFFPFGIIG